MTTEQHLWDIDHPYYCSEANYYSNECHADWDSWESFFEKMGASDEDMNLLFRWDWRRYDAEGDTIEPGSAATPARHVLQTFWVMQRKGRFVCHEALVTEADEPAIRAWLAKRFAHLLTLWAPFSPTTETTP